MEFRLVLLFLFCLLEFPGHGQTASIVIDNKNKNQPKVHYLTAGEVINFVPTRRHRGFFERDFHSYCYQGNHKTLGRFFETIELQLEIEGDDYTQYEGVTPEEVKEHYDEQRSLFSFNLFSQKRKRLQLSPFQPQCIGIDTVETYRVRLHQVRVDFWRVIQLLVGFLLFLTAEKLSHNEVFYYITGVVLGICSSFMLLIWLAGKLIPRRPIMYGVLIGGWTIGIYIIQMLWENLQVIVLTYRTYVFWYILVTGVVSFLFCYRLGPPRNKRSKNIIKWLLQLMALVLIYFSSHFEEASAAFIILTILYQYFPRSVLYKLRAFYLRRFPPKRRLLTNEEYYEEGVRETTRALEDLRKFASSPDCKQWKVMTKLHNPMRFAAFVEGSSHLRDEEILRFESFKNDAEDYDDLESDVSINDEEPKRRRNSALDNQRQQQQYTPSLYRQSPGSATPLDISEEEEADENIDDDDEDAVVFATSSNFKIQQSPPITSNSSRRIANGGISNRSYTSPLSAASQRNSSVKQHTLSRSAKMVTSAQRNNVRRAFEAQDISGDSDGVSD